MSYDKTIFVFPFNKVTLIGRNVMGVIERIDETHETNENRGERGPTICHIVIGRGSRKNTCSSPYVTLHMYNTRNRKYYFSFLLCTVPYTQIITIYICLVLAEKKQRLCFQYS